MAFNVQVPDIRNALVSFDRGQQSGRESNRLNSLLKSGELAARGDNKGAAAAAFAGGNLNAGIAFKRLGLEDQKRTIEMMGRLDFDADTPEKRQAAAERVRQLFGDEKAAEFLNTPHGQIARESVPLSQQIAGKIAQAKLRQGQTKAQNDRAFQAAKSGFSIPDPANPGNLAVNPTISNELTRRKRAGSTKVTVNAGNNKFSERFGTKLADNVLAGRDAAESAQKDQDSITALRGLLDKGIISGTLAQKRARLNQIFAEVGLKSPDPRVDNTQAFVSQVGQRVAQIIKQFGAGTGLSDADREFALKIAGGNISMTEAAIRRILELGERANRFVLERHQKRTNALFGARDSSGRPLVDPAMRSIFEIPKTGTAQESPRFQEGQMATGPNGEKIIFQNGKWEQLNAR